MVSISPRKPLVNVLGVVYVHKKTSDGGDLYLTRFAEDTQRHLDVTNWYERGWFNRHKMRLTGTSSVYRIPTKKVSGRSLDLVVKNCRVGEDVPLNTHTLKEFCDAEFNSPWEEFALVMEMREAKEGPLGARLHTQRPLAIYVPPDRMQPWQSGRSKSRINRIMARHPGIDLDILKQYKLIYQWIRGKNIVEVFEQTNLPFEEIVGHLRTLQYRAIEDLNKTGYLMADMKPEHIIVHEKDLHRIDESAEDAGRKVDMVYQLMERGDYSVVDYELLFRTPEHEDKVKYSRRHSYLDYQRDRFLPTPLPSHLSHAEIFGVPYVFGHTESTGGRLWVVGKNASLFDYFLPERWRKTPSLSLSGTNEVFYTVTKDNIHLVWKTSRVGERLDSKYTPKEIEKINHYGINSPFEEFAIAHALKEIGIHSVYVRAVYMTGSTKMERSSDFRKYKSHENILDSEGNPVLRRDHNYITIRGYYNGPDEWVPEHEDKLLTPVDLSRAVRQGLISGKQAREFLKRTIERLRDAGYDGTLLKANDLLVAVDGGGEIMKNASGEPDVIICNFEMIWKVSSSE